MEPNWQNRTMRTDDNPDIMRGMNSESVDLICLDPPFNSNRNDAAPIGSQAAGAAFKDTWTLSDVDEAWHGKGMKSYLIVKAMCPLEMRRLRQAHRLPLPVLRPHRQPLPQDANGFGVPEERITAP